MKYIDKKRADIDKKRTAFITKLRRDVPTERLIGAMVGILQQRYKRAGVDLEPDGAYFLHSDPEKQLQEFLQDSSIKQLKIFREIAEALEFIKVEKVSIPRQSRGL